MSISAQTMATIQQAGQALDAARAALQDASQQQSARVAEALGANPFGVENDAHFEHWKTIARMAQAVQAMEEQMKTIYQTAGEMALAAPVTSASTRQPLRLPRQDVVEVVEPVADVQTVRARRAPRAKAPAAAPVRADIGAATGAVPAPKGNAARVLQFLRTHLRRRGFTRVTHVEIVDATGIPLGSVGAALLGLKNRGLLVEGERGSYQLV